MIPLKSKTERMNNSLELFYCQAPSETRRFVSFLLNSFCMQNQCRFQVGRSRKLKNRDATWKNVHTTQTPAN